MMNVLLESLANLDKLETKRASEESFDPKNEKKQGKRNFWKLLLQIIKVFYNNRQALNLFYTKSNQFSRLFIDQ